MHTTRKGKKFPIITITQTSDHVIVIVQHFFSPRISLGFGAHSALAHVCICKCNVMLMYASTFCLNCGLCTEEEVHSSIFSSSQEFGVRADHQTQVS